MSKEISNTDDVIDSRDVIARIEELEAEDVGMLPADEFSELWALKALADEASGYAADWQYGEMLIHDDYFETYAQELAEEIGAVDPEAGWPLNRIDWESAADDLKIDYTSVEFDGETYWIR